MRRLTVAELMNQWQQIPDTLIWKNIVTGEFVAVHGSRDKAWFIVKKTSPHPDSTWVSGTVNTRAISPYFVLRSKPIGEVGRESNATVREYENWQYGTLNDALTVARRYMAKQYSEQPLRRKRRY